MLEPSSCYLSLNKTTHFLIQPSFSLKYRTGSFSFSRRSQSRACIVNSLYVTAENFYDLLGISESGSLSEIKQAYKQLVRKYHPDVSPPERIEEYTQRFIQVQEAYETLSDPKSRALYDTDMAKGFNLAFSVGNRYRHVKQDLNENRAWKIRWQAQLTELERRSMNKKNCKEKMSWAARIRMQAKG
ncbi:hypothetical protein COLO4_28328 [Corchorus olitorius]|uniref:J domain-containing protein n=1 Tax=Corchorus olitorius TaxID=93759 RepID=A0A1R3HLK4_9ROSI|nr:hypothetical protein COLO4_28328 [Corchorus olitorius]